MLFYDSLQLFHKPNNNLFVQILRHIPNGLDVTAQKLEVYLLHQFFYRYIEPAHPAKNVQLLEVKLG